MNEPYSDAGGVGRRVQPFFLSAATAPRHVTRLISRLWLFVLYAAELLPLIFFFFNDTATTELYTLSLHYALPISQYQQPPPREPVPQPVDHVVRSSDYGGAHAESRYSSYVDADGNIIERRQQVYHDAKIGRAHV